MSNFTVFLVLVVLLIAYAVLIYNRLVQYRNRFKNAFSQIDVQLTRRYELIPNIVESAKAYLEHESETLENVISARNQAARAMQDAKQSPGASMVMEKLAGAEAALSKAMGQFNLVVENYPELKADKTISQLTEELISTENRVSFARQSYNDDVMIYNTRRESFPDLLLAGLFGFKASALLEMDDEEARKPLRVNF